MRGRVKPSGFTLVFDGNPDEVARILAAAGDEYRKIQEECAIAADSALFGTAARPHSLYQPRSSLRGRLELRHDAHAALLEQGRPE